MDFFVSSKAILELPGQIEAFYPKYKASIWFRISELNVNKIKNYKSLKNQPVLIEYFDF